MSRSCCFREPIVREVIDPHVHDEWRRAFGVKAPFGNLRRIWKQRHCETLNPYGDEYCPYDKADCATAFLQAVQVTCAQAEKSPTGYFRSVAQTSALKRADEKPMARATFTANERPGQSKRGSRGAGPRHGRLPGGAAVAGADESGAAAVPVEPSSLRRTVTRPVAVGQVLGSLDLRPRERPADDGQASPERPSPSGDAL